MLLHNHQLSGLNIDIFRCSDAVKVYSFIKVADIQLRVKSFKLYKPDLFAHHVIKSDGGTRLIHSANRNHFPCRIRIHINIRQFSCLFNRNSNFCDQWSFVHGFRIVNRCSIYHGISYCIQNSIPVSQIFCFFSGEPV